jgi:addiction module RelB/DinJ family antitoxin
MERKTITLRIDARILKDAEDRLAEQGLSVQDAIDALLERIAKEGTLPFPVTHATQMASERSDCLATLYGENPTEDAEADPGFFEDDEENPFLT